MKKIFLLVFLYCQLPAANCQPDHRWQQQANYTIDVSLNDIEHTLDGFVKIQYSNHSPDTLSFIWFHLWPNAYKNDQTAFSEQLLQNGRTDFYFSDKEQKGYINRLDFRVDGAEAKMEDHPLYIDVCKVLLPHPLAPGGQIEITTPFHEKLPFNFSGMGHIGQSYQLTQWYPQAAVYDQQGWHEMPYLDQGGWYSEFGDFNVRITLPENYGIAATGELQNDEEIKREQGTRDDAQYPISKKQKAKSKWGTGKRDQQNITDITPVSAKQTKTLVYTQDNVNDFVWFADKRFSINYDTIQLASGKIISIYSYYLPTENTIHENSIPFIKAAIRFHSSLIGDYPYSTFRLVETKTWMNENRSYPGIAYVSGTGNKQVFSLAIEHAAGLNWFRSILGADGRRYHWMVEGMNAYYDKRYKGIRDRAQGVKNRDQKSRDSWLKNKLPDDRDKLSVDIITKEKTDQPISTSSADFSELNYRLVAVAKAAFWMKQLEDSLGIGLFDSCMHRYFSNWQFKHPYPNDFRAAVEQATNEKLNQQFALLEKKGPLTGFDQHKKIQPAFLFSQKSTDKINYINFAPAAGYNIYDKFMIGAVIHNINLPPENFQFFVVPLYATNSRQFNGMGDVSYSWYPDNRFQKIEISLGGARFSSMSGIDSNSNNIFGGFYKIVPSLRFTFRNKTARSSEDKWIEFKTFLIGEKAFDYVRKSTDSMYYPTKQNYTTRYLNQLTFNLSDYRVLYPYTVQLQLQQASEFYRLNFTTNYFFNYSKGGGMDVRFFAAKFGYLGQRTTTKEFETSAYQPKLTATRGDEDYTYSNYFIGRNESTGFASQQIMMKDGGLKLRTDLFQDLQGRSDNWIAAVNFNTTLPPQLFPAKLPLKIFVDIGTYAGAWSSAPSTSRFLYVGGLQLSLFKNILNIYAPLIYSSDFSNNLRSVPEENTFWKKVSFSIDVQNINFKKMFRNTPF